MGKLGYIITLIICFILILFGIYVWNAPVQETSLPSQEENFTQNEEEDFEKAQFFIKSGKPQKAIQIIQQYRAAIENNTEMGKQWLALLIEASKEIPDVPQLLALFQFQPEAFANNEEASLMIAEVLLITGKKTEFNTLRSLWAGRETATKDWLNIDADELIFDTQRAQAIALLKSHEFPGKEDSSRLLRLALLQMTDNPQEAWNFLEQANEKDPGNPEILSYRAKLLDMQGKDSEALAEYIAAASADPQNLALKNQLLDFFLRHKKYLQAVQVMEETIKNPAASDAMWLKGLFWNRVIKPFDIDWQNMTPPKGKYLPVVEYMISLKPWEFWNEENFEKIVGKQNQLYQLQPLGWLKLFSALKKNNEHQALNLLQDSNFDRESWNPELALALARILNYREQSSLAVDRRNPGKPAKDKNSFFAKLSQLAAMQEHDPDYTIPREIDALLKGPLAFTAALLAAGWNEAALDMQSTKVFPTNIPDWVASHYTQALRENRGDLQAMEFAALQHKNPSLDLLIGEMMLSDQNFDGAIKKLTALSDRQDYIGVRAAWLLSVLHLDNGEYDLAKALITNNQELAKSTLGKEALARIALANGDTWAAEALYTQIQKESPEATSYFARKAFNEKNWPKARELTIELLKEYPNNSVLQQNLLKIEEAQTKIHR